MSVCFHTVFLIVGSIEGFSIWKGKKLLDLPHVESIERKKRLTKEVVGALAETLKQKGDQSEVVFGVSFRLLGALLKDTIGEGVVVVGRFLLGLIHVSLVSLWHIADWIIKYSALVTIPALAIIYLKQSPTFCNGEEFCRCDLVLWFVYIKVGCYFTVFAISLLAYCLTRVKLRKNQPIAQG